MTGNLAASRVDRQIRDWPLKQGITPAVAIGLLRSVGFRVENSFVSLDVRAGLQNEAGNQLPRVERTEDCFGRNLVKSFAIFLFLSVSFFQQCSPAGSVPKLVT